jgi:hypothetical protein
VPDGHGGQTDLDENTPWLALVLIAEGEAELRLNQDVAHCVTSGVTLEGTPDVAKGNCLVVRQSVLERLLPSQKDVPLLAHAREVDINDTELMMGDDDGFLAVVISNRLPVAGLDPKGDPAPVKYLACLINLEGQFHHLIPQAPTPIDKFTLFGSVGDLYVDAAMYDHVAGGGLADNWGAAANAVVNPAEVAHLAPHADGPHADGPHADAAHAFPLNTAAPAAIKSLGAGNTAFTSKAGYATQKTSDVYAEMAKDFAHVPFLVAEAEYTFPVLLHWSFTSTGNVTFESLMQGLDSGLYGSLPAGAEDAPPPEGRPPLEVVETGHVGLTHRTRRGDTVRCWYRGPLLPHPSSGERLAIAHASDQLRAVIPDGREDVSLATAFEVGRLLALSRPAMVAALLRWRQLHFQTARLETIWDGLRDQLPFDAFANVAGIRREIEGVMRDLITADPDQFLGGPRMLVGPGDPVDWGSAPLKLLSQGLALDVDLSRSLKSAADLPSISVALRDAAPPVMGGVDIGADPVAGLHAVLDEVSDQLVSNVLASEIVLDPALGSSVLRSPELGTVVVRAGDIGAIVNQPGGISAIADIGPRPRADEARPARLRRSRKPRPVDPLDELLVRRDEHPGEGDR